MCPPRNKDDDLPDKEVLERRKLKAELEELKVRTDTQRSARLTLQTWVGVLGGLLAVATGIFAFWRNASNFLDQRRREYEFRVDQEIIALSRQLTSDKPLERQNAALLLSAFEEDAVPMLVSSLRRTEIPELPTWVIASLQLIINKPRIEREEILEPLTQSARLALQDECRSKSSTGESVVNHLQALQKLACQTDTQVIETLKSLKQQLTSAGCRIGEQTREGLRDWIEQAIDTISNREERPKT